MSRLAQILSLLDLAPVGAAVEPPFADMRLAGADEERILARLHAVALEMLSAPEPSTATPEAPAIGLSADLAGATEEQRRVVDLIASGPRGSVPSPFLAMLDAPHLARVIQEVGAVIRFGSTLPDAQREIAILATAGAARCGYEWTYHAPAARAAGVPEATIAAAHPDAQAHAPSEPDATIIALCRELIAHNVASPTTLASAIDQIGRTGASECVAIAGYYALLANFIKTAGFDQPFG
ncbi:carboxymuconolactone decarboxylase family protein [Sphingobium nicotianae]|uniref:Carboxymuconolactone decarboxylase family protein n=1 Tax=Sphingobium nicotianae TaxID=2782607 RepID=A0A9X1IRB6_9SPHN|nr:carboxymuconolactone decarboxylase family protein [Sphingobium nicotianae]MBT2187333.1 carboxymuconolactone decarboxylase family protein [Sphingobium nicotianae]